MDLTLQITLQLFVSLILVAGSLILFAFTCRQRDFDHADRLALFPLDDINDTRSRRNDETDNPHSPRGGRDEDERS